MNFRIICSNSVKNFMGLHYSCMLIGLYFVFILFKGRKDRKRGPWVTAEYFGEQNGKPLWVSIACSSIHEAFEQSALTLASPHQALHK